MEIALRNARGERVDPVPWLVVTAMAFMLCYAFVPVGLAELGASPPLALGSTTALFLSVAAIAFDQLVWRARPDLRREIPPGLRLQRYILGIAIGIVAMMAITLLFLVP